MAGMWSLPAGSYQSTTSPPPAGSVVSRARVGGEHRDANGAGGGRRPGGGAGGVDGLPEPPASLADIERMPLAELQSIAGDPAKFDHYISSHQHTR